jgi:hypothetical protein
VNKDTIDEAPMAYKKARDIIPLLEPMVNITHYL